MIESHDYTERWVLGSMLLSREALYTGLCVCSEDSFAAHRHSVIWRTMADAYNELDAVDAAAIHARLESKGQNHIEFEYLIDLMDAPCAPSTIEQHANRLNEMAAIRKRRILAETAADCYKKGDVEGGDAATRASTEVQSTMRPRRTLALAAEELLVSMAEESKSGGVGLPTGFTTIDRMINGLQPGTQMIIGANTHHGKTTLALQVSYQAIERGYPVLYFSLEATEHEFLRRASSLSLDVAAGPRCWDSWSKEQRDEFADRTRFIARQKAVVDYTSNLDKMLKICRSIRPAPRLIVVDHIQLVQVPRTDGEETVRRASNALKNLTNELQCSVILLSQFSRTASPHGEPEMQWLKHSSSLEQDADTIVLIGREKGNDREATLYVKKNRRHGHAGPVKVGWSAKTGRFIDYREDR